MRSDRGVGGPGSAGGRRLRVERAVGGTQQVDAAAEPPPVDDDPITGVHAYRTAGERLGPHVADAGTGGEVGGRR